MITIENALDDLNDIILDEYTEENAQHALEAYCEQHDQDPEGFTIHFEYENGERMWSVSIAEE